MRRFVFDLRTILVLGLFSIAAPAHAQRYFQQTNLVSDGAVPANTIDPNLVNPWGLVFNPTGFSWVTNNHSSTSTLYDGQGVPSPAGTPLIVALPSPGVADGGAATGIVFSGSSQFVVSDGINSGPSRFLFATEDGTILGWAPNVSSGSPPPSHQAQLMVDNSGVNANYKGLAIADTAGGPRLYATDFRNNRIDVFDGAFQSVVPAAAFVDPLIPSGYAPFGIQELAGKLYVTYAAQDDPQFADDNLNGAGFGFVSVFDNDGNLLSHLIGQGPLNAPWGLTIAPSNFGIFKGDLLVGNFGDGLINAFDPDSGNFLGTLTDVHGHAIADPGLWALQFGNGLFQQGTGELFFTVGVDDEEHGLYGKLTAVPEPRTAWLALGAAPLILMALRSGRRRTVRLGQR